MRERAKLSAAVSVCTLSEVARLQAAAGTSKRARLGLDSIQWERESEV